MDIHILHDGKQVGPFSEETVQSLLKQGNILINDLSWRPGLPEWQPLHALLYPAAQPPPPPPNAAPPPIPPPVAPAPSGPAVPALAANEAVPRGVPTDLATPRQKAFLSYLGVPYSADLGKETAALLVNEAMENPKNAGRLKKWDDEKLRLYPDLFADEIKARKENRAQQYYEVCLGEGAEFFEGITKAHTQLLVGYLDVRFPTWEKSAHEAKYDYFFPAIAEKFPQLLKKTAKGRFKYPDGPKVAKELTRGTPVVRARPKTSPVLAALRGIMIGLVLLAAIYGASVFYERFGKGELQEVAAIPTPPPAPIPAIDDPTDDPSPEPDRRIVSTTIAPAVTESPEASLTTSIQPAETNGAATPAADPAMAASATPSIIADSPEAVAPSDESAPAPLAPGLSLFDSAPPPSLPPPADPSGISAGATATPRTSVTILKPTVVPLRFGSSTLSAGTVVPLVSVEGAYAKVRFGPDIVSIPVANTDLASATPASSQ
jgi:hypothetical protein